MMWSDFFTYSDGRLFDTETGSEVGTKNKNGYYVIYVDGRLYYRHRIIYELFNGEIKGGMVIDHIKPVTCESGADDRIENLRAISHADNLRKGSGRLRSNNTSGIKGVSYDKRDDLWIASICVNGNRMQKRFKSLQDALNQRIDWERKFIL